MIEENRPGPASTPGIGQTYIKEVRYSLKTMLEEVKAERKGAATLGRELVDSTEISKMFPARKRKKKSE